LLLSFTGTVPLVLRFAEEVLKTGAEACVLKLHLLILHLDQRAIILRRMQSLKISKPVQYSFRPLSLRRIEKSIVAEMLFRCDSPSLLRVVTGSSVRSWPEAKGHTPALYSALSADSNNAISGG